MLRQLPLPPTARFPVPAGSRRGTAPAAPDPTAAALSAATELPARHRRPGDPTAAETTRADAPDRAPARRTERNA